MAVKLLVVGCGKMGNAILSGLFDKGIAPEDVVIVEPGEQARSAMTRRPGLTVVDSAEDIGAGLRPQVVVFAVKPQMMNEVAPSYAPLVSDHTVFLSIAAGRTIGSMQAVLGNSAAIVRAMPNTPASVHRGITVACGNQRVTAKQRTRCEELLSAVGDVVWIEDECLMDAVTAVSGSGPAYVFLLVETLTTAGIEAGLSAELAARLARATVAGAGELLHVSETEPELLRKHVTSPGGTTAAALEVLMAPDGLQALMTRAVHAARDRSLSLAN